MVPDNAALKGRSSTVAPEIPWLLSSRQTADPSLRSG